MSAHRSELHDDPSIDFEHRCIECGDEALDRCQCCGAPLCGRHHETGGGFCQDFTSVETDLGRIPACIRRVGDDLEVDTNPRLLHGEDDLPDPDNVTRDELEDVVRERLPEAIFERAARDLADIVHTTQDNQILGKGWAMHIVLKRMAAGERHPDAESLEAMVDVIDDLLRRVERATDDETDVHIANDYSIAIDLSLVRDEIERVRGTKLVDEVNDGDRR